MQIFAPTAIFEPRRNEKAETLYWPVNELAEQLCQFRDCACLPVKKLTEIEDMGMAVEIRDQRTLRPERDYEAIVDRTMRKVAEYRRKKQAEPKHVMDWA